MPLQQLHHYYEFIRTRTAHCYFHPCVCALGFFACHRSSGLSCSMQKPVSYSCSLYADSRPANHQALTGLVPCLSKQHGFDCTFVLTTLHRLFTFVQLHDTYLTGVPAFSNCVQHHGFSPTAPSGGLKPAPECRSRGTFPHLLHSMIQLLR